MKNVFQKAMARVKKMNLVPYAGNGKTQTGALHCSVGFTSSAQVKRRRERA